MCGLASSMLRVSIKLFCVGVVRIESKVISDICYDSYFASFKLKACTFLVCCSCWIASELQLSLV